MMAMVTLLRKGADLTTGAARAEIGAVADKLENAIRVLVQSDNVATAANALSDINGLWANGMATYERHLKRPALTIKRNGHKA